MKKLLQNKLSRAILLFVAIIIFVTLISWLWLRYTIPPSVNVSYTESASDTHLQASLSYCLSGPERVYAIKALYAEENIDPESDGAGWIMYHTGTDLARDITGGVIMVDFDTSGQIIPPYQESSNQDYPYSFCIPLKVELEKAIP